MHHVITKLCIGLHKLCNHSFLFQRIRAQDYSHYYEWPECAGVAYDPALTSLTNEYSYSPASSGYIHSPPTQQPYYSQDALIGGLQYPPEWKKTPLPKTSPSNNDWSSSSESSHQPHITENHSSNYHGHTEDNKASSNSRSNTHTKEMPLDELINSFMDWYQPTGQTKHTVNPNSHHNPLSHNNMLNSGTHTNQPDTANGMNVPQASHSYKRNSGTTGDYEASASQQEQYSYTAPQQQEPNTVPQQQQSFTVPQQPQSYTKPQQQPQNAHHLGHTPTTNSGSSSSTKSYDLQHMMNTFMDFVTDQHPEQVFPKPTAETNFPSTLPHLSHSNTQTVSHQPYQQTQQKAAHKRTTSSQTPVSYTNIDHNLQQHNSESGNPIHHRQAVPNNCPSFSDPILDHTYDSYVHNDANIQTFLTDTDKSVATADHPQTHYNSVFNGVPINIQPHQINEETSFNSAISPIQTPSNTDLTNKYNSPPSHLQSSYTIPNQYQKSQTHNAQTDPMLFSDKTTSSTNQNYKTNTNTPPRNNMHSNQNTQQYGQNLISQQPTATSHDYSQHPLTTWSQQSSNTQQTPASSPINNKQSTKNKQTPQDDLMKNIDVLNEFLGKRFNANKPKQNTQPATNMNFNKQQNPQAPPRNIQQEMLFQQMIDDNFPQIIESLTKTPATAGKGGRHQTHRNGKRNLLQQVISENLPGIIDSLNKNHPQFQNKNGEIDLRQLQNLLQQ